MLVWFKIMEQTGSSNQNRCIVILSLSLATHRESHHEPLYDSRSTLNNLNLKSNYQLKLSNDYAKIVLTFSGESKFWHFYCSWLAVSNIDYRSPWLQISVSVSANTKPFTSLCSFSLFSTFFICLFHVNTDPKLTQPGPELRQHVIVPMIHPGSHGQGGKNKAPEYKPMHITLKNKKQLQSTRSSCV